MKSIIQQWWRERPVLRLAILAIVIFAVAVVMYQIAPKEPRPGADLTPARVERVVDGDTVVVDIDGEERRVRLLNIDTPEKARDGQPAECFANEATEYLAGKLPAGTMVDLEYDVRSQDQYGRDLVGVWLDGVLINAEIARMGYAYEYDDPTNSRFIDDVREAIAEAKAENRALWGSLDQCQ